MSKYLKRWAAAFLYHCGILSLLLRRLRRNSRGKVGLILTYHHIRDSHIEPETPLSELESGVSLEAFRRQIDYVKAHFEVTTVAALVERLTSPATRNSSPLAVSFDDGYRSVRHSAFPVLQEAGVVATVYVPSGFVDSERRYWWLIVSEFFATADATKLAEFANGLAERSLDTELLERVRQVSLDTNLGRVRARGRVALRIDKLGEQLRREVIELMSSFVNLADLSPETLVLRSNELRELLAAGWEVGAHTTNHTELTSVDSETALVEMSGDRQSLDTMLKTRVSGLAYPYGRHGKAIVALAREAGYTYAVTTQAAAVTSELERYAVPRISIGLDPTLPQFAWFVYRTLRKGLQQLSGEESV